MAITRSSRIRSSTSSPEDTKPGYIHHKPSANSFTSVSTWSPRHRRRQQRQPYRYEFRHSGCRSSGRKLRSPLQSARSAPLPKEPQLIPTHPMKDPKSYNARNLRCADQAIDALETLDALARESSDKIRRNAALAFAATQTFNYFVQHFGNATSDDTAKLHKHEIIQRLNVALLTSSFSAVPSAHKHSVTPEGFTKVHPGGLEDVEVTTGNLLSEALSKGASRVLTDRGSDSRPLPIRLVNNLNAGNAKAYITGLDSSGKVFFILDHGDYIYPDARSSRLPVKIAKNVAISLPSKGGSLSITLPPFIRSGRIYFSDDDLQFFVVDIGDGNSLVQPSVTNMRDPNANVSWGFVEFTYIKNLLYANISYVDFVGIVLGMKLVTKDGKIQTAAGLEAEAVVKICDDLVKQRKIDNFEWTSLCIADTTGKPIRVLSPGNQYDINPGVFSGYWRTFVDKVWENYTTRDLVIDTQSKVGMVKCRVIGQELKCDGHDRGLPKPDDKDIWGCNSGPFAISENASLVHTTIVPPE
ncbi:related to laminaripentaose-producing beta-1,3-glucanase [Fusarium torulosum]|uniref:Related to laminaripentaose-producing beta-1,3-glucanase n=1 Tax=Fusarium torulosum TaxID=33205 RepID=A0AAE8ML41_9HYPO|nr:related to laminaripentaose-producing beta-1,3-glucanase [Fusarium torulosum]